MPKVRILAYKSTLLFVVKSSKNGDLAQILFFTGAYTASDNAL